MVEERLIPTIILEAHQPTYIRLKFPLNINCL